MAYTGSSSQNSGIQIAPLVLYKPNPSEDPSTTPAEQMNYPQLRSESVLAGHVRQCWQRNKIFKEKIQLELLQCLRAKNNQYSQAELSSMQQNGGSNFVWIPLTETKTRACSAWVREILLPVGDRAWQLTPSPLPQMPVEFKEALLKQATEKATQTMQQAQQAGGTIMGKEEFRELAWEIHNQMHDETVKRAKKLATQTAERAEDRVEEILSVGGYYEAMDSFIEDFSVYKAAIMCGPVWERKHTLEWLPGWKVGVKNDAHMTFKRIDPFDCFPAPYATDCQKGDLVIRVRYRRDELFDMIGIPGFREDMIRECLRAYSNGHMEAWLWTEAERQRLQNETMYTFLSPWGIIDALWYWGAVPGWKLQSWGIENMAEIDPVKDYEVECQVIGPYVIMCRLNPDPMRRRPFWKACYSAKPGSFWGHAVPELAETSQKMCNAAASALADNMGMASGPMVWVHTDRLADGESSVDVFPWRVWQLRSDATQGVNPGVGFFQPDSNATELQNIIDKYDLRADDDTGIPRYTYGNDQQIGGAADTYAGLSMLMNNAAKGLRRAITNVDLNVIEPLLQMVYEFEMLWGKDETIKGDAYIEARGAAAILVKEAQRQGRMQALQVVGANPMAMQIVGLTGYAKLLTNALRSMDGADDEVVPSDKDVQKMQDAQTQQQAQALQQAQAQAAAQQQFIAGENQKDRDTKIQVATIQTEGHQKIEGAKIGAKAAEVASKPRNIVFHHDERGNIIGMSPGPEGGAKSAPAAKPAAKPAAQPGGE
jgi:hypothetical protein